MDYFNKIAVLPESEAMFPKAKDLADHLQLPLISSDAINHYELILLVNKTGLGLQTTLEKKTKSIVVDFLSGSLHYRAYQRSKKNELIAKAIGLKNKSRILDLTAGLGQDAFILACLGYTVHMVERSPIIAALLKDGLERAQLAKHVAAQQLTLTVTNSIDYLSSLSSKPTVIYLDPMFPEKTKSALAKKEMRILKQLVGADEDADILLQTALIKAKERVVVKRPRLAPYLADKAPSFSLTGSSVRFDVYLS